ncbi:MAG: hypothetical protein EKK53_04090 [Burkholderiales bacterium]|nr:MAG: hypothetical protein EKK53_04090 [Burkholderiales bacterium]
MSRRPYGFDADSHERHRWWRNLLFKLMPALASCALLTWWMGWGMGLTLGVVIALRFTAQALAPELVALAGATWRQLRWLAFKPVQGRFYQFKGHRIRVEDDDLLPQRWLALSDLATALGGPMPAPVLRRRWPEGVRDRRDGVYLLDEVALAWLSEQRDDRAGRLHHWVQREVWYPARGRRASYTQEGAPSGAPRQD